MLVQPNKTLLGDTVLNAEESILRQREKSDVVSASVRIEHQDFLADQQANRGQMMYAKELIRRILRANPNIRFTDGAPGSVAMQRERLHKLEYIGGFPLDWLPEFSSVTEDRRGRPSGEIRGWRNVLARLLNQHALSFSQVMEIAGDNDSQRAKRWLILTRDSRI